MPAKDLRHIKGCQYKGKSGIGIGRVQSQRYGITVAGMLDVSIFCSVTAFDGGQNEVNNSWSLMMHVNETAFHAVQHDTTPIRVRPSAGDSLFVFVEHLDTKSPGFKAFRDNVASFAGNFGGNIASKFTAAVTSNSGGGAVAGLTALMGQRALDIRCVPGNAFDGQGAVDPATFWKTPPHIAFLWQNPTLGDVAKGVLKYIQRYGVPGSKRYVTTAVHRDMPRKQVLLSGGRSRLDGVTAGAMRDDALMLAEWFFG